MLDGIYRIAHPPFDADVDSSETDKQAYREAMKQLLGNAAEYPLCLAYGGLVVRWLASELEPELLLSGASERVIFVGVDDGDSLCVGRSHWKVSASPSRPGGWPSRGGIQARHARRSAAAR